MLFQPEFDHPTKLRNLVSESWNAPVIDNGATNTVTGEKWLQSYMESLSGEEKTETSFRKSSNAYRFDDGKLVSAMKNCEIPALIANTKVKINTDVVSRGIPLLLSWLSMKRANMTFDFENDTAFIFGQKAELM